MKGKKLFSGLMCAALLAAPSAALADSSDVHLLINNAYIGGSEADGQAYISDAGRTMIPLRLVSEVLDYQTDWQPDGSIRIHSADGTVDVTLQVGSTAFTANDVSGTFETAPTLKNDRTYLPARDFTELYGDIYWDNDSRTVWIAQSDKMQYQVIDGRLLRADNDGIQQMALPEGYTIYDESAAYPIMSQCVINDTGYLAILCKGSWTEPLPLFRDDGDHLTYLTDIYPSCFCVDGDTVYYTDGFNAGGWSNPVEPNRLYAATIGGDTVSYMLDFAVNACVLDMVDGQLTATDGDGVQHVIDLSALTPVQN